MPGIQHMFSEWWLSIISLLALVQALCGGLETQIERFEAFALEKPGQMYTESILGP